MTLTITNETKIADLQYSFASKYPFLQLEFYKLVKTDPAMPIKKYLPPATLLKSAGLINPGILELRDEMTVVELEKSFLNNFGLETKVSRKCGMLWIETTITNKWSLHKQNEHGRELSLTAINIPPYMSGNEAV